MLVMHQPLFIIALYVLVYTVSGNTGFWYGGDRPPSVQYDTVPYANMTVRVNRPFTDGPGQDLVKDPFNPDVSLYVGNTINRQTFDTQFVLDMSYALNIDTSRIYVLYVSRGRVHFTWESNYVIVSFIFLERNSTAEPTLLEAIADLTQQIQVNTSALYTGTNVTSEIDSQWGLDVVTWDVSLKLTYAIGIIGGNAVKDGYYLNQGSLAICDDPLGAYQAALYCEFERFFEDDVSRALDIDYYRVQVLFIKSSALDSVLVHFRITPPDVSLNTSQPNVTSALGHLYVQVNDPDSLLYKGNVTIRTDPSWGVSQFLTAPRQAAANFTLKYYEYDPSRVGKPSRLSQITAYDRCKANRRCNWGITEHDQNTNDVRFFQRLFDRGTLYETNLFLDFEDWRMGSRGFSWSGYIPPTARGATSVPKARAADGIIRGAHFWPFDQDSLGPDVPCYMTERNQGLVLDRSLQRSQIDAQMALVDDLQGRIDWLEENIEDAQMRPELRSRKDVRRNLTFVRADFEKWRVNEVEELRQLNSSQCIMKDCTILFNTSSLELTGAINDTGVVKLTPAGTEVALFTFNSIYLGPEVKVIVVGQRALALLSKTTLVVNTTIEAAPGTLGGFPGGGSVARYFNDNLNDRPRPIFICDLNDYCAYNTSAYDVGATPAERASITSNNVNGPGSGNLRINAFVLRTSADYIQEIQVIQTQATAGQTLAGGFTLSYKEYTTPIIPHDATPTVLKRVIEENLNLVSPANFPVLPIRIGAGSAGVGVVSVTRSAADPQEGFTWKVTFNTAIGNIAQLTYKSYLLGAGAQMNISTERQGNEIGGTFQLEFQGARTRPILAAETAEGLSAKLQELPMVATAYSTRIDPTGNCDDGFCPNGPFPSRGLLWTVYITTNGSYDNVSPTSPTSPDTRREGFRWRVIPRTEELTGANSTAVVYPSTVMSLEAPLDLLNVSFPFSLAYGGGGASYGGVGGAGYGINPLSTTYNSLTMSDLLGGSGGAMRSVHPYEINAVLGPVTGRGGHGGGAIELIAANDLTIGSYGRIIARGGDGDQTSGGGGGGGSGGGIVLTSGTSILVNGTLDVGGGSGGYGGGPSLSGGGGGGGRVAIYAESITINGKVNTTGGRCGALKTSVQREVVELFTEVYMIMLSPLDDERVAYLGLQYLQDSLQPTFLSTRSIARQSSGDTIHVLLNASMIFYASDEATADFVPLNDTRARKSIARYQAVLDKNLGVNIGEVFIKHADIKSYDVATIFPVETSFTECSNPGSDGTLYTEAKATTKMYIAATTGAESTSRALFLSNREMGNTTSGSAREAPFSANGPIVPFEASRPSRITYYSRTDGVPSESLKVDYGSLFALISRGESGLNVSNVIGVFFGSKIMHGSNFGSAVDEAVYLKRLVTIDNYPILSRWYKVDIKIQWVNHTYSVSIDDLIVTTEQSFQGDDVDGIRLSTYRSVDVWFDEIYVGFDNSLNFQCPITLRTGTSTQAPVQRHWSFEEVHGKGNLGYTAYNVMTRHYNFLDTQGSIAFDGQGQVNDNQDIKLQYADGDYPLTQGLIHAGALVYLTNSLRSGKTPLDQSKTLVSDLGLWSGVKDGKGGAGDGRQFWYTEYNFESDLSPTLNGGVAACSSQDLNRWRFEGIVFHYTNLSDLVFGEPGPFYVERPKVLFNAPTGQYVMWAVMDREKRDLGLSAIATSPYEDGPFLFRRSFYPDGNQTRDQVIFVNDEGQPLLGRTYYQTVEFLLPQAIMQPVWESAKNRDGSINYRNSYHRAVYDPGYDNFNDIYLQRWRKEDIAYEVQCVDRLNSSKVRTPKSGEYNADGDVCNDPSERKVIIGQGVPVVTSMFISPNNSNNSFWRPTSVPMVLSQAWSSNYRDGFCGIRKLNDDMDLNNPDLANFVPDDRGTCSNIADNPIHATFQDKLIGLTKVITTRRAKFIALSALTFDFLDTTGYLTSFEGELESGDLISLIVEMGQFGFAPGNTIRSTFAAPVRSEFETAVDFRTRFSQYIRNVNDRASYSLACVLDGVCPVNFRDQLTSGQF